MTPYIQFIIPKAQFHLNLFNTKCEVDKWYFGLDALSQSIFLLRQSLLLKYLEELTTCRDNPSYQQFHDWLTEKSNHLSHQPDQRISELGNLAHRFLDYQGLTPGGPRSISAIRSVVSGRSDLPGELYARDFDIIMHYIQCASGREQDKPFRVSSAPLPFPGSTTGRVIVINQLEEVPYATIHTDPESHLDIRDRRLAFLCGFKHNMSLSNFLVLVGSLGVSPEDTGMKSSHGKSYEFLLDYMQTRTPAFAKQRSFHLKNHYDMSDNFAVDLVKAIVWKHRKHDMKLDSSDLELLFSLLETIGQANQRSASEAIGLLKSHGIERPDTGPVESPQNTQLMNGQAGIRPGTLSLPLAVVSTEAWFDDDEEEESENEDNESEEKEKADESEENEDEEKEETEKKEEEEEPEESEKTGEEEEEEEEEPEADNESEDSEEEKGNSEPSTAAERIAQLLGFDPKPVAIGSLQELIFRDLVSTHIKRLLDQKQTSLTPESIELLRQIRLRWLYTLDIDELMSIIENILPSEMHLPK